MLCVFVSYLQVLHANGCAPRLYCTFQNGICYEFMQGDALGTQDVRDPSLLRCGHDGVMGVLGFLADLARSWYSYKTMQASIVLIILHGFYFLHRNLDTYDAEIPQHCAGKRQMKQRHVSHMHMI